MKMILPGRRSNHGLLTSKRSRYGAALALAVALALWPLATAYAHANLISSDPPDGAALAQAPSAITLTFSEDLASSYTSVELRNSSGQVVAPGPGTISPDAPRLLRLALPRLPDGAYTAVWQAQSATDGHLTQGNVAFTVGQAAGNNQSLLALLPPAGAPDPATAWPPPGTTALTWLSYLSAALLIGSLAFGPLVWSLAYRAADAPTASADARVTSALKRLAVAGLIGLALLALVLIVAEAAEAAREPVWLVLPTLGRFLAGRAARLTALRGLEAVLLLPLVRHLPLAGAGPLRRWSFVFELSLAPLLTFSLQTHSAALDPVGGTFLVWAHLLAMGVWLGGLLPLALTLRIVRESGGPAPALIVPRFSRLAIAGVAVLGLSGLLNALPLIGTLDGLTGTTQGRALMAKTVLFALLIGLGAINLLALSPRLRAPGPAGAHYLSRTVTAEVVLGLVLLAATSVMTDAAPAQDALLASQRLGPHEQARIGSVTLTLRITPGKVGNNAFAVDVVDGRPGTDQAPAQVLLRLSSLDMPDMIGTTQVETKSQDGKRYAAVGSYFGMDGNWQVKVILRRSGFDDVTHNFAVRIGYTPIPQTQSSAVSKP